MAKKPRTQKKFQFGGTEDRVRRYFRSITVELAAAADRAICDHQALKGGHREAIQRTYLSSILPARFRVGRGMIYADTDRSREADIVIWDADNYPSLPLEDHAFFFAESVRLVLESKSQWSAEEFADVLDKCKALRHLPMHPLKANLN